jgi:hypothetical protein
MQSLQLKLGIYLQGDRKCKYSPESFCHQRVCLLAVTGLRVPRINRYGQNAHFFPEENKKENIVLIYRCSPFLLFFYFFESSEKQSSFLQTKLNASDL